MISLRSVENIDKVYFAKWWRDPELVRVTSGDFTLLSDEDIDHYFEGIKTDPPTLHYMINADNQTIGHISLSKRTGDWWETQIVIGEKEMQGKGFGTEAIAALINEANHQDIKNIYLEVRPDNIRAINAYKKVGFKQVGEEIATNNENQPRLIRMEYSSL
jgi:RimJ/RimL family protein N-acetyltransferase